MYKYDRIEKKPTTWVKPRRSELSILAQLQKAVHTTKHVQHCRVDVSV